MAMGGSHSHSHKGNGGGGGGGMSGRGGKPYAVMLLVAFGAALVGVMVIHKLRERRMFGLLVKEKDRELLSLQLILQKEREYSKEMKRKTEEMKAKIYSLRMQKMELDTQVLELQSSIDSLKDEHRAIETALEEKQNEIEIERERKQDLSDENLQLLALQETLKQKQVQIENLKRRIENPVNASFVGSNNDRLSDLPVNSTLTSNSTGNSKTDKENSTRVEFESEKREESTERKESNDEDQVKKNGNSQETEGSITGEKNTTNSTESVVNAGGNDPNPKNEMSNGKKVSQDQEAGRLENSQEDENQNARANSKGEMKLERADNTDGESLRVRGRHGRLSRLKGKKWRTIARRRNYETSRVVGMRNRRFHNKDELWSIRENGEINRRAGREAKAVNPTAEYSTENRNSNPDGRTENMEVSDMQKQVNGATNLDSFRFSAPNLEEDKEEYKEEIYDSEF